MKFGNGHASNTSLTCEVLNCLLGVVKMYIILICIYLELRDDVDLFRQLSDSLRSTMANWADDIAFKSLCTYVIVVYIHLHS